MVWRHSHFSLVQLISQLELRLGNLDDLLDETGANLLLNLGDPRNGFSSRMGDSPPEIGRSTYCSASRAGSLSQDM